MYVCLSVARRSVALLKPRMHPPPKSRQLSLLRPDHRSSYPHRAVSLCHGTVLLVILLWFICERCCCCHLPRPKQYEGRSLVDQHLPRPDKAKRDIMTSYQAKDGICGLFRLHDARVESGGDGQKGPGFRKCVRPFLYIPSTFINSTPVHIDKRQDIFSRDSR